MDIRQTAEFEAWLFGLKDLTGHSEMSRKAETKPWDAADYIETDGDVVEFLKAALEERDPAHLKNALSAIARSKGGAKIAARTGLDRDNLLRVLSTDGDLALMTLIESLDAMDMELDVKPKVKAELAH